MLTIYTLYQLLGVGAVVFWWWRSIQRKELAQAHAKRYCKTMDLQWLDQNLVLRKRRWNRVATLFWQVERYYEFEFATTGKYRHIGYVIMDGRQLRQIITDPYEVEEDPDTRH